ncbi:MAG: hypothetical protein LBO80_07190 [Treponema sp.]|jgi:hypothetical protein|nr:hypothetical protein [Treponema sp.]
MGSDTIRARFKAVLQKETLENDDALDFLAGLTRTQRTVLAYYGLGSFLHLLGYTNPKKILEELSPVEEYAEAPS